MNAKEYLQQISIIDQEINYKLQQLEDLESMATHITSVISDMPKAHDSGSRLEDAAVKIADMKMEINKEVDELVDLKAEAMTRISRIDDPRYRLVLEERYIHRYSWEDIATDACCSLRSVHRLHGAALKAFQNL